MLQISASESTNFIAIAFLPWIIKPVFGSIADSFPLFGYRFRGAFYACFVSVVNLAATFGAIAVGWLYDRGFAFPLLAIGASLYGILGWVLIPFVSRKISVSIN
jgi:hypothetical protein